MTTDERRRRFAQLSGRLALLDDDELARAVGRSGRSGVGWSGPVTIGEDRVFVKRIPVTDLEAAHRHSTKNLHRLPTVYSYGVGSAGFGAYRELATHVRTTGWVLAGEPSASFPMLLHARPLPRRPSGRDGWIGGDDYVRSWNGSRRIGAFVAARVAATEELVLVMEHVPHTLFGWLLANPSDVGRLLGRLCDTLAFLHERGVLHFDAHWANVVTDGDEVFLTDFGLAVDAAFELSPAERSFFDAHQHYDFGEAIANLGALVVRLVDLQPPETRAEIAALAGVPADAGRSRFVARALPRIMDAGLLDVHADVASLVARYLEVIDAMWAFFDAMHRNRRKDTPFDDDRIAGLIADAGGLPTTP